MGMLPPSSAKYMDFDEYDVASYEDEGRSFRGRGDVASALLTEVEIKLEQDAYKRPDQVRAYVSMMRRKGEQGNGLWKLDQEYWKKLGKGRARVFFLSLRCMARGGSKFVNYFKSGPRFA